ncbi:MAG: hypothetical protein F4Y37_09790 [Caldilineaceae bacterium SB0664_bin_22]|nr:hypothetical protein [Caldilineaceae bacterium SB0664_bin_22]MYC63869.1 hypothetical protein [Caldilineaceae bacterium SB0661_bin_34]
MITQQSLWLPGLNIERPGVFKPVVPGTGASPHASILKALRGGWLDGWISVEEASGNGLDGLAAGFGHTNVVGSPSFKTWFSALRCCIMIQRYCYGPTLLVVGNGSHTIQVQEDTSDEHS